MEAKTVKNLSAALFCILIFALTTLVGGLTFYYRRGMENADRIFLTLSEKISSLSPAAEELPAETVKSLDEYRYLNSNLAAVSVRLNNKLVYISPVSSPHFAIAPDGTPLMNAPAPFLKQTVRTFTVAGQTIELAAITHILQVQEVLKPARIAFLMILSATLAAVLLLVYQRVFPLVPPSGESAVPARDISPTPPDDVPPDETPAYLPGEDTGPVGGHLPKEHTDGQKMPTENDAEHDGEVRSRDAAELPTEDPQDDPGIDVDPPPVGMFSDDTGFIRESYIGEVLGSHLLDADRTNADLSLFIMAVPGLLRTSESGKAIGWCLLNRFKSTDLLFEYKKDRFAAIIPDIGFDDAVREAEQVYLDLTDKIAELELPFETAIGISTKQNRTVSALRLLQEADQAAEKAVADPENPIVALKIDLEKYRAHPDDGLS